VKSIRLFPLFFLLIAFYLASGVPAFAAEVISQTTSEEKHSLQKDTNGVPLFVEEISPSELFQAFSENSIPSAFGNTNSRGIYFSILTNTLPSVSVSVLDQRKRIGQYLFPYHFFW
jgi:hypothetical protein